MLCKHLQGRVIAEAVSRWGRCVSGFPPRRPGFEPRSSYTAFVVDKVALGHVFSGYLGFPCQFSLHRLLNAHHHLSSGAGTIGQTVGDVPSELSVTPPQEKPSPLKIKLQLILVLFLFTATVGSLYVTSEVLTTVVMKITLLEGTCHLHLKE
jgi:hypothetical protein